MKTSDKGIAELAGHEAIVLAPYKDSVGVWTWGIGHTKAAGNPDPLSLPKAKDQPLKAALDTFRRDIAKYEADVNAVVKVPLKQHQFDALVSWHFNTGAVRKASLIKKLNASDYEGAAKGLMDWNKPPEMRGRRQAEQRLFRTGQYGDGMASVYPADASGRVLWSKGKRLNVLAELIGPIPVPETPVQPADAPAAPSQPTGFPMPPKPPAAGPTPKQTGIGALILALLVGVATQFQQVWAWVWPWGLIVLVIIAVAGFAWWRRSHYKPNPKG
jgi:lysozyme